VRETETHAKSPSPSVVNESQSAESSDPKLTEPSTRNQIISNFIEDDPTVLPPQDEFISKQTTTEDVTTLLTSAEDFGSTKDIPQLMLQPRTEPVGCTSSEPLISLLADSNENEYVLSTNECGEIVSEVQTSGNNGAVISDSDSVITIISLADDPVTSVAPCTSISDNPDDVVTLLECTDADDTITNTLFSDIHHENRNEGAAQITGT
jgi:hypothetical protein